MPFEFTPKIFHNGFAFAELDCEAEIERDGSATFSVRDLEGDMQRIDHRIDCGAFLVEQLWIYIGKNMPHEWAEAATEAMAGVVEHDREVARGG